MNSPESSRQGDPAFCDIFPNILSSSKHVELILDSLGEPVFVKDGSLRFVYVNKAFCDFVGKNKEELIGSRSSFFATEKEKDEYEESDRRALEISGRITSTQTFFHSSEGLRHINTTKIGFTDDLEKRFIVGVVNDITAPTNSEIELLNLVAKTREIVNSVQEGIIIYGPDLRYKEWNPYMEKITGKKASDVIGRFPSEVFPFLSHQGIIEKLQEILQKGGQFTQDFPFHLEESGISGFASNRSQAFFDDKGNIVGILGTVTDVTSRALREKILNARAELYTYSATHTTQELLQKAIDDICELTGSSVGFYHFFEPEESNSSLQFWSTLTEKEFCKIQGEKSHHSLGNTGVLGNCVRDKKPIIHNDYLSLSSGKSFPEGHVELQRELVVPIMKGGDVVAILGVGNKLSNYTQDDQETVSFIADVAWHIAEQKIANEALKKSKDLLEEVGEMAKVGGWEYDVATGKFIASQVIRSMRELDPEFVSSASYVIDSCTPEYRPLIAELFEKVVNRGEAFDVEFQVVTGKGNLRWQHAKGYPIFRDGKVAKVIGISQDITERKNIEENLRTSEERYRLLIENSPDAIAIYVDGKIKFANKECLHLIGADNFDEILDKSILHFVHKDTRLEVIDRIRSSMKDGAILNSIEEVFVRTDGSVVIVEVKAVPIRFEGKNAMQLIVRDITDRKKSEEALKNSESRFRSFFEKNSCVMLLIDPSLGAIMDANAAAITYYGYTKEELTKMTIYDINGLPPERVNGEMQNAVEEKQDFFNFSHRLSSGEIREVESYATPIDVNGKKHLLSIIHDVTERKRFEILLKEREYFFRESQEKANIGSFGFYFRTGRWESSLVLDNIWGISESYDRTVDGWLGIVHPDDKEMMEKYFLDEVIGKRKKFDKEYRTIRQDTGEVRWVHGLAELEADAEGDLISMLGTIQDITDRKKLEQERQESENLFRTVFNNAFGFLGILKPNGQLIQTNSTANNFIAKDLESIYNQYFWETPWWSHSPELQEQLKGYILKASNGEFIREEVTHHSQSGEVMYVDFTLSPMKDEKGNVTLILAEGRDVTERKKMQKEQEALTRALRVISECNQELLHIRSEKELFDAVCKIIVEFGGYKMCWVGLAEYNEDKTIQVLAHNGAEDGHIPINQITWNGDSPNGQGPMGTAIRTKTIQVLRDIQNSSKYLPWHQIAKEKGYNSVCALPIVDDGVVFGALVVYSADVDAFSHKEVKLLEELATDILTGLRHIRTIEENKKAETSLRKSEEQLLQAQKIAHIGSWANDFNTGEQNWSKEIYNIFELDESEVISQDTLLSIVHPEDRESLKTHQNDLLNRRKEYKMEYRLRFLDNRIKYVYEQCEIIYDEQWRPIRSLSTIQDVTKDKEMERTLLENERADTVTRTLRQVAHDFNNILQSVAGFAELARERKNDPDAVERYVKNIINGTGTLAIRVKDLQELTDPIKSTEIHHREISLNQVVRKAVSLSASTRGADIIISSKLEDTPLILGNPDELISALNNLLINSMEAIKGQGSITIHTTKQENNVLLSIVDSGDGIPGEIQEKIWEYGFSTKSPETGKMRGYGMVSVKKVIEKHNGTIRIAFSEKGKGTCIEILIPGIVDIQEKPAIKEASVEKYKNTRILVVDDLIDLLDSTTEGLVAFGYQNTHAADSGLKALELIEKNEYDIVFTDLSMPGMDGMELIQRIRKIHPHMNIVILSGHGEFMNNPYPDISVIPKPFRLKDIEEKIKSIMKSEQ